MAKHTKVRSSIAHAAHDGDDGYDNDLSCATPESLHSHGVGPNEGTCGRQVDSPVPGRGRGLRTRIGGRSIGTAAAIGLQRLRPAKF